MAFVRKIVIVLVGISLALLMTVLLLNPDSLASFANNLSETSALVRIPVAVLLDAFLLAVIVILLRGERAPRSTTGLAVKAKGAIADVGIDSARDRILRAVRDVPDVLSASAIVKPIRGKADVELEVVVSHESMSVPDKQREIDRALRQVINKQLGLQMAGKPRVHIRMDDERVEALPPEPPAAVVIVPAEPVREEAIIEPEPILEAPEPEASPDALPDTALDAGAPVVKEDESDDMRDLPSFG